MSARNVASVTAASRIAAAELMEAVLSAARLAEQTARSHREQLEAIARGFAAYDDALTVLLVPDTVEEAFS